MSITAPESLYVRSGDGFEPTDLTIGPWTRDTCHAGPPAALLTKELCSLAPHMGMTRITLDIPGPIPRLPCRVETEMLRPGKRITHIAASLVGLDGDTYMQASAWFIRKVEDGSPVSVHSRKQPPPAAEGEPFRLDVWDGEIDYGSSAIEMRVAEGTPFGHGPSVCWFRLLVPVVDDQPTNPYALAAAVADFANGTSAIEPFDELTAINTDLTMYLSRAPTGEWVALDSRTNSLGLGLGMTDSLVYDASGFVGTTNQSIFFDRVDPPGNH